MRRVIIMRGLPGSGKSTEAKSYILTHGAVVVSADDYFMVDGKYRFNPAKIGDAHIACMRAFLAAIDTENATIVVDNTALTVAEVTPYRLVALAYGYEVEVVRVICDAETCAKRNTHGVPRETILNMLMREEHMPPYLGEERIVNNY